MLTEPEVADLLARAEDDYDQHALRLAVYTWNDYRARKEGSSVEAERVALHRVEGTLDALWRVLGLDDDARARRLRGLKQKRAQYLDDEATRYRWRVQLAQFHRERAAERRKNARKKA